MGLVVCNLQPPWPFKIAASPIRYSSIFNQLWGVFMRRISLSDSLVEEAKTGEVEGLGGGEEEVGVSDSVVEGAKTEETEGLGG